MSSAIELVESHPWRLAAAASIPIIGAAVPLYLHVNNQITDDLDDEERAKINETRNITAGVQFFACGALTVGAYVSAKVGLAILLKVSVGLLLAFLGVASSFILPAAILLIYLVYKAISYFYCYSSNSGSHSEANTLSTSSEDQDAINSFFGRDNHPEYAEVSTIDNNDSASD